MSSRIKGVSLINTLAILREVLGGNRFQAVVSTCPQETQQLIRRTLIAGEWIPVEVWAPFLHAIFEQVCGKDEQQLRRLLRAVCKRDFSTVYRQYVTQTSPQTVIDKAPAIWSAYFDSGTLERAAGPSQSESSTATPLPEGTTITLRMHDFDTAHPIYAMAMQFYLEQVLSMAGAPQCSVVRENELLREGKLSCDYIVTLGELSPTPASISHPSLPSI